MKWTCMRITTVLDCPSLVISWSRLCLYQQNMIKLEEPSIWCEAGLTSRKVGGIGGSRVKRKADLSEPPSSSESEDEEDLKLRLWYTPKFVFSPDSSHEVDLHADNNCVDCYYECFGRLQPQERQKCDNVDTSTQRGDEESPDNQGTGETVAEGEDTTGLTEKGSSKTLQENSSPESGKRFMPGCGLRVQVIETREKPVECPECGKIYSKQSNLKRHLLIHTGERPFECKECGKKFTQGGDLKRHLRRHTGGKTFECSECGKEFKHRSSMKRHERAHSGEKPFECADCGKLFCIKNDLDMHLCIDTGENS